MIIFKMCFRKSKLAVKCVWLLFIVIVFSACTQNNIKTGSSVNASKQITGCQYSSIEGQEFQFRTKPDLLQAYGYLDWKDGVSKNAKPLTYESFVNKKAMLLAKLKEQGESSWYEAKTESCQSIFTKSAYMLREKTPQDLEKFTGIVFVETINNANKLVNKNIWLKPAYGEKPKSSLFTLDPKIKYPRKDFQILKVVGIDLTQHGMSLGDAPFFLKVQNEKGNHALLPYSTKEFFEKDPIDSDWSKEIIDLITGQNIKKGMTKAQILVAWGDPDKKDLNANPMETWIYSSGQKLFFKNNLLDQYQLD